MAYATLVHVESRNAHRGAFAANTIPTASAVAGFLEDTSAELDSILSARNYVLPVPAGATVAHRLLRKLNTDGAYAASESAAVTSPHAEQAQKVWEEAKRMLKNGQFDLPDAARASNRGRSRGPEPATAMLSLDMVL